MARDARPLRLFLDAGVSIEGCTRPWGAAKAVLILATQRYRVTVVLAEAVEREVRNAPTRKGAPLPPDAARETVHAVDGWFARVRLERRPSPPPEDVQRQFTALLPVLRQLNDLVPVVTALQARPDWVISGNRAHWNDALAARTGLRIATPRDFLRQLLS